jgi:hypothetical protein
MQNPVAFLYTNRRGRERNEENNSIHNSLKKYLGINLTKTSNNENYIEKNIRRWKDFHIHRLTEVILQMAILPKAIYRLKIVTIKI